MTVLIRLPRPTSFKVVTADVHNLGTCLLEPLVDLVIKIFAQSILERYNLLHFTPPFFEAGLLFEEDLLISLVYIYL